jgi:hypothetical protein
VRGVNAFAIFVTNHKRGPKVVSCGMLAHNIDRIYLLLGASLASGSGRSCGKIGRVVAWRGKGIGNGGFTRANPARRP